MKTILAIIFIIFLFGILGVGLIDVVFSILGGIIGLIASIIGILIGIVGGVLGLLIGVLAILAVVALPLLIVVGFASLCFKSFVTMRLHQETTNSSGFSSHFKFT